MNPGKKTWGFVVGLHTDKLMEGDVHHWMGRLMEGDIHHWTL